ncbi:MAG: amidohydrolase family protein [Bacillota bacterium]|jgi:5-methylthioadenosine/S-adenosylhomocysteine deaminase
MLIKNGYILTLDKKDTVFEQGDVLIKDNKIVEIAQNIEVDTDYREEIIDAGGKIVMPGLINCHAHSDSNLFKGYFDNLPLDIWMVNAIPLKHYGPLSNRLVYLRTLLGAIEMLKSGVTCVQDDPSEFPFPTIKGFGYILNAYKDIGMRASVTCHMADRCEADKLPFYRELLPADLLAELEDIAPKGFDDMMKFYEDYADEWHMAENGMYQVVAAPSCPHRCTDDFLLAVHEFAQRRGIQTNIHALETKSQAVVGPEFYNGRTLIEHCDDLGILTDRMTIIHGVWTRESEMEILAARGTSVAHNPVSNLKLGSGIAPLRKLLNAGVNVGLGTDGTSSNDSQNLFEVVKMAGLLHKVTMPDYNQWPNADEIIRLATNGSARACGREKEIGSLEVGKKADITILATDTVNFTPLINVKNQLVYCENGESVDTVLVDGKVVVRNHEVVNINEKEVLHEIHALMPDFMKDYLVAVEYGKKFMPYVAQVYEKVSKKPIGINRYTSDEKSWIEE